MVVAARLKESLPAKVPEISPPRMVEFKMTVDPLRTSLSEPRLPAIQELVIALVATGLGNQVGTLTAINGAVVDLSGQVNAVVTAVAVNQRASQRLGELD